jgi:hypothetical protein
MDRTDVRASCIDCRAAVTFDGRPGDGTWPSCGVGLYLTEDGHVGRYPDKDWQPGGVQGRRHRGLMQADDSAFPTLETAFHAADP